MAQKGRNYSSDWLYGRVGENIRNARKGKLSQQELGDSAGLSRSSIAKIEQGRQNLTLDAIYRIGKALGKEPSALLPALGLERSRKSSSATRILKSGHTPPEGLKKREIQSILDMLDEVSEE